MAHLHIAKPPHDRPPAHGLCPPHPQTASVRAIPQQPRPRSYGLIPKLGADHPINATVAALRRHWTTKHIGPLGLERAVAPAHQEQIAPPCSGRPIPSSLPDTADLSEAVHYPILVQFRFLLAQQRPQPRRIDPDPSIPPNCERHRTIMPVTSNRLSGDASTVVPSPAHATHTALPCLPCRQQTRHDATRPRARDLPFPSSLVASLGFNKIQRVRQRQ